ncbi:hypothetical protein ZHAS_00022172 [Anopheles sinensis]|uniref:Uncharacterized protein n=1 Tax=Anopheles sinensis TaxID=74873 RepID=A0A084WUN4_ANOSI|nr:hypothetical protein ZHAS_00022172 [Anopheles sinensis]
MDAMKRLKFLRRDRVRGPHLAALTANCMAVRDVQHTQHPTPIYPAEVNGWHNLPAPPAGPEGVRPSKIETRKQASTDDKLSPISLLAATRATSSPN